MLQGLLGLERVSGGAKCLKGILWSMQWLLRCSWVIRQSFCAPGLAHQEKCVQVFARQDMPDSVGLPNRALTRYDNVDSAALYADPIWSHRYTMKFHCPPTTKYM